MKTVSILGILLAMGHIVLSVQDKDYGEIAAWAVVILLWFVIYDKENYKHPTR